MKEEDRPLLGFIGLLYKAHKLEIGASLWQKKGQVKLFAKASDATSGEALHHQKKILSAHLPYLELPLSKGEIGAALGKEEVSFLGITDKKAALAFIYKAHAIKGGKS